MEQPEGLTPVLWQSDVTDGDCIEAEVFGACMRRLGAGVVVVTSFVDGRPWGTTLSSCSAFSAKPARLSLSITKNNVTAAHIREHESFGVAIPGVVQEALASDLARPGRPKFIHDSWLGFQGPALGMPSIKGAPINMECRAVFHVEAIDHLLVVADIVSAAVNHEGAGAPLMYYDRNFGSFATPVHDEGAA